MYERNAENEIKNDIIEGRNAVIEALRVGRSIDKIFIAKGETDKTLGHIASKAREAGIVVVDADRRKLDNMSVTHSHQGVIALVGVNEYCSVEDILAVAEKKGEAPFVIVCDEVSDPRNLGAIIRSAECAGKASAGAAEHMAIARVPNIPAVLKELKDKGLWVYGAAAGGSNGLWDTDFTGAMALVIGSEGDGIGRLVRENCDFIVNIPMVGKINSLNASAAASVIMYEVLRQRSGR